MRRIAVFGFAAAMAAGVSACGRDGASSAGATSPQAPDDAVPASVIIPEGDVIVGTRIGSKRASVQLETFRISRAPITVGQWKTCMEHAACGAPDLTAGACAVLEPDAPAVDGPTFDRGVDDIPITCVSVAQASRYCEFAHHGRVPTVEQLLLAVRGPAVRRFAWGDQRAGCDQRWRLTFAQDVAGACCGQRCTSADGLRVGLHPSGDSPYGVSDVLSTHAELAASTASSVVPACRGESGCVLAGLEPGAIDWIFASGQTEDRDGNVSSPYAASFRCAWTGEVSP